MFMSVNCCHLQFILQDHSNYRKFANDCEEKCPCRIQDQAPAQRDAVVKSVQIAWLPLRRHARQCRHHLRPDGDRDGAVDRRRRRCRPLAAGALAHARRHRCGGAGRRPHAAARQRPTRPALSPPPTISTSRICRAAWRHQGYGHVRARRQRHHVRRQRQCLAEDAISQHRRNRRAAAAQFFRLRFRQDRSWRSAAMRNRASKSR